MEKIYEYNSTKSKRKYSLLEPFKKLNKKNNNNKKYDEDDDKKKKIILIIIILLVLFLVKNLTDIVTFTPTRPKLKSGSEEWYKSTTVEVEKDSKTKAGLKYYLYCISKDKNGKDCVWKKTTTKNAVVDSDGTNYVFFKGVGKDGKIGQPSTPLEVKVDTTPPEILKGNISSTTTTIKVEIEAKDKGSGIDKYYYKLDDEKWISSNDAEYIFNNLTPDTLYKISVRVVDKVGNKKEIEFSIRTKKEEEEEKVKDSDIDIPKNSTKKESTPEIPKGETKKEITPIIPDPDEPQSDGELKELPEISLEKVPSSFKIGESYKLPSSTKNVVESTIKCTVREKEYTNTSELDIGTHIIKCEGTSKTGIKATTEKQVKVEDIEVGSSSWAGWIRMNLYFPENSTDWEYIVRSEDETRNGGWTPYTEPILLRLEDVENVYIRYKLANGETVIEPPVGKLLVNIDADNYNVREGKKANITITYTDDADKKQYRLNDGEWKNYTGSFQVEAGTTIDARVVKTTNGVKKTNYDSVYIGLDIPEENTYTPTVGSYPPSGGSYPPSGGYIPETGEPWSPSPPTYVLSGPTINVEPESDIVESVNVSITTEKVARDIYYKVGSGDSWHTYTGEFEVSKNITVYSYYVDAVDGETSSVSSRYIGNINPHDKPNVNIGVNTTASYQNSVDVTITTNGEDLEYSYDGVIYQEYTGKITVDENCRIYARAKNENGTTVEYRDITNIGNAPAKKIVDNIDISINLDPNESEVKGLINKTKVSITYGTNAEKKYYSIGGGVYQEYTGEFEVTENTTIYAYATSSNGKGNAEKQINYLTTGIASPKISLNTTSAVSAVKVSIEFGNNADKKKYKIDNGSWTDYTGEFYVEENCTIYAYNEDVLGNYAESSRMITNVVGMPNYSLLDLGDYFILKPNYPESSDEESREYKWIPSGTWKKYNSDLGILLIKESAWDKINKDEDGVKIEVNGREVIYEDHYYKVDDALATIAEDLFMRWDYATPSAPTINLSTTEPTKKLSVSIEYDKYTSKKEYKIVYSDGTQSDWLTYTGPFEIEKNNTTIYARGTSSVEVMGKLGSRKITNIDEVMPTIDVIGDFDTPTRRLTVTVRGKDNLGVEEVGYIKGEKTLEELLEDGHIVSGDNTTFKVDENGKYTVYVQDKVGNTFVRTITVDNIDLDAPDIDINVLTTTFGTEAEVEIDYGDSTTKQYSIGNEDNYKTYSGKLTLKANDYLNLMNSDGSLTIYAKGTDTAGNSNVVSEKTYVLDLDAPKTPIINASAGYPILTEYGVQYDDVLSVIYDDREDIINYISVDNGTTWQVYTGVEHVKSGTIKAKSVKKSSGLTITSTKTLTQPTDALSVACYDGNTSVACMSNGAKQKLYIDENMYGQTITIVKGNDNDSNLSTAELTAYKKDGSSTVLHTRTYSITSYQVTIPENTSYLLLYMYNATSFYEIRINSNPIINIEKNYPTLTQHGVEQGYNNVTINYYQTAVQKQYSLDNGEIWLDYTGKIELPLGQKIVARSIDKNGVKSSESSYTSSQSDAIGVNAYDGDNSTYFKFYSGDYAGNKIKVSPEMIGQKVKVRMLDTVIYASSSQTVTIRFLGKTGNIISEQSWASSTYESSSSKFNYIYEKDFTIPANTDSILIKSGAWNECCLYFYIYEIQPVITLTSSAKSLSKSTTIQKTEESNVNLVDSPVINVNNSDVWSISKEVEISYPEGYKNQYSFDAVTWNDYTGKILLTENGTIYARSVDSSGNVVSSSSYKVTKIDSKSGTISLDIPDEITVGDSYSLPSSYSFEEVISGGSASCSVNGNVIENTSSLEVGTYNIECISKTNAGIEVNINKNLKVVEKKGEESNEEEKNTPSSEATEPDETTDENKVEETEGE